MDKQIQKKKWTPQRLILLLGSPVLLFALIYFAMSSRASTFKTDFSKLQVATVEMGQFQEMISFQCSVEPLISMQLDAQEGGTVEAIYAEEGMMVDSGQALLRLSNPSLRLDFMNRETQIVEQINNLRSTRITLDQNKRQVQEQLVDLDYDLREQYRQYGMDSTLYQDSAISESDFLASKTRLVYLKEKKALLAERMSSDEQYRQSQLTRIDNSVDMMERNLEAIRKNLENLTIRASLKGQLNSFDHEVGQTKNRGENLGRIDVLDQYQLSALVDQYYLNRIQLGQVGTVEIAGKPVKLEVKKIFPTVVNSQFEVELAFQDSSQPSNIRRGQNFQIKLELSASKKALLIPRGAFSQSNAGKYVYVVDSNTGEAHRREVQLGSQNPLHIEVLAGLEPGEQIITSSYNPFGEAQTIILTQYNAL